MHYGILFSEELQKTAGLYSFPMAIAGGAGIGGLLGAGVGATFDPDNWHRYAGAGALIGVPAGVGLGFKRYKNYLESGIRPIV
jgi:hypothetical protein